MTTEIDNQKEALERAIAPFFRSSAQLLLAWKARLPAERRAQLTEFEGKGLTLALSIEVPKDRCVIQVYMLDQVGGRVTLETIAQRIESVAMN